MLTLEGTVDVFVIAELPPPQYRSTCPGGGSNGAHTVFRLGWKKRKLERYTMVGVERKTFKESM